MNPPEQITLTGHIGPVTTLKDRSIFSCYTEPDSLENLDEPRPERWVYVRTSNNGGRTWTDPRKAFAFPAGKGGVGAVLPLGDGAGNLHIFSLRFYRIEWEGLEEPQLDSVLQHTVSRDGGTRWSEVKQIDFGHRYTGSLNGAVQMDHGRLLVPLSYFDEARKMGKFVSMTVYSDDGGQTWGTSNDCPVDSGGTWIESGACEPVVVPLRSGMVWMVIRTQSGYFWESFSNDGALWTPPQQTRIVSSNSPAGVLRLADGRIVLFWNNLYGDPFDPRSSSPRVSYARQILHGAISENEGQTWSPPRIIAQPRETEPPYTDVLCQATYPYLCQAPDGAVVLIYVRNVVGAPERSGYRAVRVDPDWLAGPIE